MKGTASVWVTHRFAGFHHWPTAPEPRAYLADLHRHLFYVRAEIEVEHDDRDVEFHDMLAVVAGACSSLGEPDEDGARLLGPMSCEMIARRVVEELTSRWPGRPCAAEVSEDGECGAKFGVDVAP